MEVILDKTENTFLIQYKESSEKLFFDTVDVPYVIHFDYPIMGVDTINMFNYYVLNETKDRYLKFEYSISRNDKKWTRYKVLDSRLTNFPELDPLDPLYIRVRITRKGGDETEVLILEDFRMGGILYNEPFTPGETITIAPGESRILRTPYIFKVFKLTGFETISSGEYSIKWRYTQDSTRTWSQWELLTQENISTKRISPIRFFQVEYLIENESSKNVYIKDINLVGDFQNVSLDYKKTNLYGVRECCSTNFHGVFDSEGNWISNEVLNSNSPTGRDENGNLVQLTCESSFSGGLPQLSEQEQANLFNPYDQKNAVNLLDKLSQDAEAMFGHPVNYFLTEPDGNGIDKTLHEYSLYNVVKEGNLKVSVPDNNFPDNQVLFNQFDLNLFDKLEVHITKTVFKQIFGVDKRPSKEDYMYFCNLNRMFKVEHSQQFRSFNNEATYYRLILGKYNQKADHHVVEENGLSSRIAQLVKNTTIDELFGVENNDDKKAVAKKQQFKPLTVDPIRVDYMAKVNKELIENSSTVISRQYYDLYSVKPGTFGVKYKNLNNVVKVSDNLSYLCWFNANNILPEETINLFSNLENGRGWDINIETDDNYESSFIISLNGEVYTFVVGELIEETWYGVVLNIDQRNRKMTLNIYKRNTDYEEYARTLKTTTLKSVYSDSLDNIIPMDYEIIGDNVGIKGSDIKLTNIRLFNDIISEDIQSKILNMEIIGDDSKHLIFGDNANNKLELRNFPLNQ